MKRVLFTILFLGVFIPVFYVHASPPIKILIVPGHDDKVWGARYKTIKEADMNLALGTEIFKILKKDKRFDVKITREPGGYTFDFKNYFEDNKEIITSFKQKARENRKIAIQDGTFVKKSSVPHVAVNSYVSNILYGINKWADDNQIDLVLHIHFNDYPRPHAWTKGEYRGFTIYVPEDQNSNAKESVLLGKSVFAQLSKKYAVSTYQKENGGIVADQSLIALGASGTLDASVRSILIEYGYIYRFGNKKDRYKSYKNMAEMTTAGIKNYFFK